MRLISIVSLLGGLFIIGFTGVSYGDDSVPTVIVDGQDSTTEVCGTLFMNEENPYVITRETREQLWFFPNTEIPRHRGFLSSLSYYRKGLSDLSNEDSYYNRFVITRDGEHVAVGADGARDGLVYWLCFKNPTVVDSGDKKILSNWDLRPIFRNDRHM